MARKLDFHSSSIYRLGWKDGAGIGKAQEVDYQGRYAVPDPEIYRRQVRWWARSITNILLDEIDDEDETELSERDKLIRECTKKGMNIFASRKRSKNTGA